MIAFIGLLKYLEPETSFFITPKMIEYCHLNGKWTLPWQDIIRFGEVKADVRGQHTQLPYLGIKLNNLEHLAKNISPRLANKLIVAYTQYFYLAIFAVNYCFSMAICLMMGLLLLDSARRPCN